MHQICRLIAKSPTKLSKAMHESAFKELGVDFSYELMDTENTGLAIREMRELSLRGYSLTIPHKENALELIDVLSEDVKKIGAANTVINKSGKLYGYNTDWQGIDKALSEVSLDLAGKNVTLLGAGGASRAALYLLKEKREVKKVFLKNRTFERAENLAKEFSSKYFEVIPGLIEAKGEELKSSSLLINSTPLGSHLADSDGAKVHTFINSLTSNAAVFDMVTKKETAFLEAARKRDLKTISGLRMLLHQAVWQSHYFTEVPLEKVPVKVMEEALYRQISSV